MRSRSRGVLITGSSRGVGAAAAHAFASNGDRVVVGRALGRPTPRIEAFLEAITTYSPLVLPDGCVIEDGNTVGVTQFYRAVDERGAWYTAEFIGHVAPSVAALELEDVITLHLGDEVVQQVRATPGFPAQSGSRYLLAN